MAPKPLIGHAVKPAVTPPSTAKRAAQQASPAAQHAPLLHFAWSYPAPAQRTSAHQGSPIPGLPVTGDVTALNVSRGGRKAPRLRADEHPWTTPVGADVRVPHRLTGIVAARAGRVIIAISAGSVIGWRANRGADDGAGRKPTKNSCAYGTAR